MRIDVYDLHNRDRLLGSLRVDRMKPDNFYVAVYDPFNFDAYMRVRSQEGVDHKVTKVAFTKHVRRYEAARQIDPATLRRTITETTVFLTDAPLRLLMEINDFYLPGEDPFMRKARSEIFRGLY